MTATASLEPLRKYVREPEQPIFFEFAPDAPLACGHYDVAAGICWPFLFERVQPARYEGFVALGARARETRMIYIVDEMPFATLRPVKPRKSVEPFAGLYDWCMWAQHAWALRKIFYAQPPESVRTWLLEWWRLDEEKRLPELIELPALEPREEERVVWQYLGASRLRFAPQRHVHQALRHRAQAGAQNFPAIVALSALLRGFSEIDDVVNQRE